MDNPNKDGELDMGKQVMGTRGKSISLLVNHFKVTVSETHGAIQYYDVSIEDEDCTPVVQRNDNWRKILDKVREKKGKDFAYDGQKKLISTCIFPIIDDDVEECTVVLDDYDHLQRESRSRTYRVHIKWSQSIPMNSIGFLPTHSDSPPTKESKEFEEALRALNIILRHNAAQRGCLLVHRSFSHNNGGNSLDLGGGVYGCRGFHSSFRPAQGGLSLNMDVSTTMIVKDGPLIDFLMLNQNVDNHAQVDWIKAKNTLKNLRVKVTSSGMEYKISGLSDLSCREQTFLFKQRSGASEAQEVEITVYDYFTQHRKIKLECSGEMPCVDVGKPNRPTYFPAELCSLVPLQRYTKSLSDLQRASLVKKSRLHPKDMVEALELGSTIGCYADDPLIQSCGVSISTKLTKVQGRVLPPPQLEFGNKNFTPHKGKWDFTDKTLVEPVRIERWAVVNFSASCDKEHLCGELIKCAQMIGMVIAQPDQMFDETERPQSRDNPASIRVDEMIGIIKSKFPEAPQFLLCILPKKKNSDLYGPWKKASLCELGVATQCIAPTKRNINNKYLTNVLLKINAKLGGLNSLLTVESINEDLHLVYDVPTLIVGMDVSHGSPGRDAPSVAAIVSSREWPLISKYRAAVRSQPAKTEIIEGLFKEVSETIDEGIFREILDDFIESSEMTKPDRIIIFRDGVSESQFNKVTAVELREIIMACKFLDDKWSPKVMVVVAQKNHHTKIFQANPSAGNVPPGTVIDNEICHPIYTYKDFYMCAHDGMIGTTRPTHYHVLFDNVGYSADQFQELVHSLSYVYQRSSTAISIVAPIRYAHLAAAQVSQFIKLDEQSSSHGGGPPSVPELPILHKNVCNSMFFC